MAPLFKINYLKNTLKTMATARVEYFNIIVYVITDYC